MRKPCERCVHAIEVPHSGLHCARSGGWYRCEDERALGWFAARVYDACGTQGRFFTDRLEESNESRWALRSPERQARFGTGHSTAKPTPALLIGQVDT
jgi:hypothetical protein